jgi:hypothetical protein
MRQQSLDLAKGFANDASNILFLNDDFLFKYCTEMKMPLPGGYLGFLPGPYSQSYPQNL